MAVSGMLSRQSVKALAGDPMWPTNLGVYAWTGAMDSYFCNVFGQDVGIRSVGLGILQRFQGLRKPWLCSQLLARAH